MAGNRTFPAPGDDFLEGVALDMQQPPQPQPPPQEPPAMPEPTPPPPSRPPVSQPSGGSDDGMPAIDKPPYYATVDPEPIKVIDAWGLNFSTGNAVKYIARYKRKGTPAQDLRKAAWYLIHEAERIEAKK